MGTRARQIERLSLAETLAWMAWFDTGRSIGAVPPPERASTEHGELTPEGREWWNAEAQREHDLATAARALGREITNGTLTVSGRLVKAGSPHGDVPNWQLQDPIPREVTRLPCEVPLEWVGYNGGWLIFIQGAEHGLDVGPRYCTPAFDAAEVKGRWKQPRPERKDLVRCMTEEGRRYLAQTGKRAPRPHLIDHCICRMACTNDEAEAALLRVPEELRRVRGRAKQETSPSKSDGKSECGNPI